MRRWFERYWPILLAVFVGVLVIAWTSRVGKLMRDEAKAEADGVYVDSVITCHPIPGRDGLSLLVTDEGLYVCPLFMGVHRGCWSGCPPLSEWLK